MMTDELGLSAERASALDKPSLKSDVCCFCGTFGTEQHHFPPRSGFPKSEQHRIPTFGTCGQGNTSGCHMDAAYIVPRWSDTTKRWSFLVKDDDAAARISRRRVANGLSAIKRGNTYLCHEPSEADAELGRTFSELVKRGNEAMFSRDAGTYLLAQVIHDAHLLNAGLHGKGARAETGRWATEHFAIEQSTVSKYLGFGELDAEADPRVMSLTLSEGYYAAKAVRDGAVTVAEACDFFFPAPDVRRTLTDFRAEFLGATPPDEKPYCSHTECPECKKPLLHHPKGA